MMCIHAYTGGSYEDYNSWEELAAPGNKTHTELETNVY
jgi:hypothetical protein